MSSSWCEMASVAAKHDVPIDIHMDAITQDGPTPPPFRQLSPKNPATLNENVSGLELLLDHDRRAKIVWAHAGSDRTGEASPQLYSRLMASHPNLYLQLILSSQLPTPPSLPGGRQPPNVAHNLTDTSGAIRAEYLEIIRTYPDRITVGGDSFFAAPGATSALPQAKSNLAGLRELVDKLPDDVVAKVSYENAVRLYKLTLPQ